MGCGLQRGTLPLLKAQKAAQTTSSTVHFLLCDCVSLFILVQPLFSFLKICSAVFVQKCGSACVSKTFPMMQMRLHMLQWAKVSSWLIFEAKQEEISAHVDAAPGSYTSRTYGSHPLELKKWHKLSWNNSEVFLCFPQGFCCLTLSSCCHNSL